MKVMHGSLGLVEQFFDAELAIDNSVNRSSKIITPLKLSELANGDLAELCEHITKSRDGYCRPSRINSFEQAFLRNGNPTFLLTRSAAWESLSMARKLVAYTGPVAVDDPVESGILYAYDASSRVRIRQTFEQLARWRPLIKGGYVNLIPPRLADSHEHAYEAIKNEDYRRDRRAQDNAMAEWTASGRCGTSYMRSGMADIRHKDRLLQKLSLGLSLSAEMIDTTRDRFIGDFLGSTSSTQQIEALVRISLPCFDRLPIADLAALLSGDEVLASVRDGLNTILTTFPREMDATQAGQYIDRQLAVEFARSVQHLEKSLGKLPSMSDVSGVTCTIGATIYAGLATNDPKLAVSVATAGAATGLVSKWISGNRSKRNNDPALRALKKLAMH